MSGKIGAISARISSMSSLVLAEESDIDLNGNTKSHFELYLDSMSQIGASTDLINSFVLKIIESKSYSKSVNEIDINQAQHSFAGIGRAMIQNQNQGLVKVYAQKDGPLVGASICGPSAGEMIHELMYMVGWEALPHEAAEFIHAHPTLSEAVGESLLSLNGKGLH